MLYALLVMISCWSFVTASPYAHYVQQVLEEGNQIELNDGSVWKVKADPFTSAELWDEGDEVVLRMDQNIGEIVYFLENLGEEGSVPVETTWNLPPQESALLSIQDVTDCGRCLTLADGSVWQVGWANTWHTAKWKSGEKVFVFAAHDLEGYYLTNLDRSTSWPQTIYVQLHPDKERIAYQHYVAEVLEEGSAVKLDNGCIWKVAASDLAVTKVWQEGETIALHVEEIADRQRMPSFFLRNVSRGDAARVYYEHPEGPYFCYRIQEICDQGDHIILDRGVEWRLTGAESVSAQQWKLGDRIMVYADFSLEDAPRYFLVNDDWFCNASFWYPRGYGVALAEVYSEENPKTLEEK